jgi:hypothetical protein
MTWNRVKFFYQHSLSNLVVASEQDGYEIKNILSPYESTLWKAASTKPQFIDFGSGSSPYIAADYLGAGGGHNLKSAGASALLMFSDDGFVNSVGFVSTPYWPGSDGPFVTEFAQSSHRAWRLSLCGSARGDYFWEFTNSSDGWTAGQAGLTVQGSYITHTSSTTNPWLWNTTLAVKGSENFIVRARIMKVSGPGAWEGNLYYRTVGANSHDTIGSYVKTAPAPSDLSTWAIVEWDMRSLTLGGLDWTKTDTITTVRMDFTQQSGDVFNIDYVELGTRTNSNVYVSWARWGLETELDWSADGDPVGRERKDNVNVGQRGDLQGVWPRFTELRPELSFSSVDSETWQKLLDWERGAAGGNFLYSWESAQHSYDLYVVRQDGRMDVKPKVGGLYQDVKVKLRGKL